MSVNFNFGGQRVLVTGGARGVGKCIVKQFAAAGCTDIFVIDKDCEGISELREELPSVKIVEHDLTDWEGTREIVEGFGPLDHVINNAGIPEHEMVMEITSEGIDRIFEVNFKALVNVSQAAAKGMVQQGKGGTIVNISSVLDEKAIRGVSMYCCTKAAVKMLTKALAFELAPHNIRVTCVRPSIMLTTFVRDHPNSQEISKDVYNILIGRQVNKKVVTVEDTANSVLFLCSGASAMVNGSDILVDGGVYTN